MVALFFACMEMVVLKNTDVWEIWRQTKSAII